MTLQMDELFLSEDELSVSEDEDYIWKTVLRTGQWALTPGMSGTQRKPLIVVRDGKSDTGNNVISLAEIEEAFNDGAFEHVTVPLATNVNDGDHADIARNNTGFVRKLKIVEEDGVAKLKAAFDFTEPDIKERVMRGTIPNTSAGILYDFVRKSDAKKFPVAMGHVALTHRPWIDEMEPFGIAASDDGNAQIASFEQVPEADSVWEDQQGLEFIKTKINKTLHLELDLSEEFEVVDVAPGKVKIQNKLANIEWTTTYTLDGETAKLPPINEWSLTATKKIEAEVETPEVKEDEPVVTEIETPALILDPENLRDAHLLREERFSQGTTSNGGLQMSKTVNLDGLNLSELSDDARAAVEALQERNLELEREARVESVEAKVKEWGDLGLSAAPGFLKEARRIMLSDDGGTAGILLADSDNKHEEKVTATEIVERLVNALPKTEEGKLELSGQVEIGSGPEAHEKPPVTDDERPLEDRLRDAREALGKPVESN